MKNKKSSDDILREKLQAAMRKSLKLVPTRVLTSKKRKRKEARRIATYEKPSRRELEQKAISLAKQLDMVLGKLG